MEKLSEQNPFRLYRAELAIDYGGEERLLGHTTPMQTRTNALKALLMDLAEKCMVIDLKGPLEPSFHVFIEADDYIAGRAYDHCREAGLDHETAHRIAERMLVDFEQVTIDANDIEVIEGERIPDDQLLDFASQHLTPAQFQSMFPQSQEGHVLATITLNTEGYQTQFCPCDTCQELREAQKATTARDEINSLYNAGRISEQTYHHLSRIL